MTPIVQEWLSKADHDLTGARHLAAHLPEDQAELIMFLCQQCVEKMLKAALVGRGLSPPKIHDLADLSRRLTTVEPAWAWDESELRWLTAGAVAYRYPGRSATAQEAVRALDVAERARVALLPLL